MSSVLSGFCAIWLVIGVGWLLGHLQLLDESSQKVLVTLSFFVGNPALLMVMMSKADLRRIFAESLLVTFAATVTTGLLYLLVARLLWRRDLSQKVLGAFCSAYVNAGNMGLPIAAYILGDVTWVAPLLLMQVALLQPIALALLDVDRARADGRAIRPLGYLSLPVRNPMTLGVLAGVGLNVADLSIPGPLLAPLQMVGNLAVPTMLIAFGLSLRLGPLPGAAGNRPELAWVCSLKVVVHPLVALGLARLLGLDAVATRAVVVLAALPTAQNAFTHAVRYGRRIGLARDVVFITSIASMIAIALAATLLHTP